MKRFTYQQVKEYIEQQGYRLLSKKYFNNKTKLLLQCPEEHQYQVTLGNFKTGYRCCYCAGKVVTYEEVERSFQKEGYILLTNNYVNNSTELHYVCDRGHKNITSWNIWQRGCRCPKCAGRIVTYQQVKEYIEQQSYCLLSKRYINCKNKLSLRCTKGHQYRATWEKFRQGHRCPKCNESKGEKQLGELLQQVFPDLVTSQDNLDFLGLQRVDYAIPTLKLAFEYDGRQHYKPVKYWGGKKAFKFQQQRDKKKQQLLKQNGWTLVRIKYDQPIRDQLVEALKGLEVVTFHK